VLWILLIVIFALLGFVLRHIFGPRRRRGVV